MLFVDLWQSPILVFTNYETCLLSLNNENISKNPNSNVIVKKVGNDKSGIEIKSEQVKK